MIIGAVEEGVGATLHRVMQDDPAGAASFMGMVKNYLLGLICLCSEEAFGQEAVDWAIETGLVQLTYHREQDLRIIMGDPGKPETGQYDAIIEAYHAFLAEEHEAAPACQAVASERRLEPAIRPVIFRMGQVVTLDGQRGTVLRRLAHGKVQVTTRRERVKLVGFPARPDGTELHSVKECWPVARLLAA